MTQREIIKAATSFYIAQVAPRAWAVYAMVDNTMRLLSPEESEDMMSIQRVIQVGPDKCTLFVADQAVDIQEYLWLAVKSQNPDLEFHGQRPLIYTLDGFGLDDDMNAGSNAWKVIAEAPVDEWV